MIPLHPMRRVTVVAESAVERVLLEKLLVLGARGYTVTDCRGAGEEHLLQNPLAAEKVRIEVVVQTDVAEKIVAYLQKEMFPDYAVMVALETIEVVRPEKF